MGEPIMEDWSTNSLLVSGDLSYSFKLGTINNNYIDIEITAYSSKWSNFDAEIQYRRYNGDEWRSDIQILFSTANSVDNNILRKLSCSSTGGLNTVRWDYKSNNLNYGETPEIKIKVLPQYRSFSTSKSCNVISKNSGINYASFIDSSKTVIPTNTNNAGNIIAFTATQARIYSGLNSSPTYSLSGLDYPSFGIQKNNGNYFIADTNNDRVLEVDETLSSTINTISVTSPIFLDYIEDNDNLLVTSSGGTIHEYTGSSYTLSWTSTESFTALKSATYSKKDSNRVIASDSSENKVKIINKLTDNLEKTFSGFYDKNDNSEIFNLPHISKELEDGKIIVIEQRGKSINFETFTSSSSSSVDSSSTSSMTSSSMSSSSSSSVDSSSSSSSSST
jgi:hypothetical protein